MKETPVSNCEKQFLLEGLWEGKRMDGRGMFEERNLEIVFGKDYGSCQVSLGKTKVQANVSTSVTEPRVTRPNEGILMVYVDLSPIAAPKFEVGRLTDEGVELNRTIERCLKESRCLDLESLCIVSEEKVWSVRLDIQILNHCGNLSDAASIAGLAALCHARRPDVSLQGDEVTIHPPHEKDPIPLAVHHHPVTSTFAMFQMPGQSDTMMIVCDPSLLEEDCSKGKMIIGVNAYREVCTLHLAGQVIIDKKLVIRLAHTAAEKSKKIVEKIKQSLAEEEERRKKGIIRGFAGALKAQSILHSAASKKTVDFSNIAKTAQRVIEDTPEVMEVECKVTKTKDILELVPDTMESDNAEDSDSDIEMVGEKSKEEVMKEKITDHVDIDDDSEEEGTMTLTAV